jgi:ABC-type uncharacterized transport system ATPase component
MSRIEIFTFNEGITFGEGCREDCVIEWIRLDGVGGALMGVEGRVGDGEVAVEGVGGGDVSRQSGAMRIEDNGVTTCGCKASGREIEVVVKGREEKSCLSSKL